ncbi:MAG: SPOR domain-containing protein [Pseudomonadales bacterium]
MSSSAPTTTRYRVTGALFLLALVAIFGPMLFDGAGLPDVALGPMPQAQPAVALEAPEGAFDGLDEIASEAATLRDALQDAQFEAPPDPASAAAKAADSEAAVVTGGQQRAAEPGIAPLSASTAVWAVQVASFSNRDNAVALRGKLRDQGFEAFLSDVKVRSKTLTRVAVGPYLSEADAQRAELSISDRFELEARIVSMVI